VAPRQKSPQPRRGTLARAEAYFIEHVGEVLDNKTLREAIGGTSDSWTRRVRELREKLGYKIRTHLDRSDLRPGQYMLEDLHRVPVVASSINKKLRAFILERNGYTCGSCGIGAGDTHEDGRPARLQIGHIIDASHGGTNDPSNLRALCSLCNEGSSNISPARQNRSQLLASLRRARPDDQEAAFEWLKKKLGK
jgi:5-methylcytosine-specific restriction endonuclease McrA